MTNSEWLQRYDKAVSGVLPKGSDIVVERGEGSYLWDVDGNKYLDFGSGIAVTNTGHCHPSVVSAVRDQVGKLIHTSVTARHMPYIELAEKIGELCPFFNNPQVFLCNSGAEAVDGAIKLARIVTGKPGVIAFEGGFHGRTIAATGLTTAKQKYRDGYEPHPSWIYHAPYGKDLAYIDYLIQGQKKSTDCPVGAVLVEPVLGEGGFIVPPPVWLRGLRRACDQYGLLLIFDEVQCGVGRTGQMFAAETFRVTPDILLFAKGIASGLPLGGIVAESDTMRLWPEGLHGSTFGGNPVSCAAALATLEILDKECLFNVRKNSKVILTRLEKWGASGIGYMIRVPLSTKEHCDRVKALCLSQGLIVLSCGPKDDTLRLIPPLTVTDEELDEGLEILEWSLSEGLSNFAIDPE